MTELREVRGIVISTGEEFIFPESKIPDFIVLNGMKSDLHIETLDGDFLANTFGLFLNRVVSMEYRETFIERLVELQTGQATPEAID